MTKKRIHFAIDESLLKLLKVAAVENDTRYSEIIEKAVIAYLGIISQK